MTTLISIDPGASGAIAWQVPGESIQVETMPDTPGGILELLREISAGGATAYLERVGGFIGRPQPGSSMFRFGEGYGILEGFLLALGIRTERVTPQAWQKSLGIGNGAGLERAEWKRRLKAEAERRFPHLKVTLSTADALLILDWATRRPGPACQSFQAELLPVQSINTAETATDRS